MVHAKTTLKPCLIILVEFVNENLYNTKLAVVRLGGQEVEINADDEGFEIANEMIRYSGW